MASCALQITIVGGGGMMGRLIGGDMALQGHSVVLTDRSERALQEARDAIQVKLLELCEKGMIAEADVTAALDRISLEQDLKAAVKNADFVSEAIVENMDIKKQVFAEIAANCPERAILSTNTMTLSISEMSEGIVHPERVVGVRFLYPVLLIPDVELTSGLHTSTKTLEQVKSMLLAMDKTPFFKAPGAGNYLRLEPSTLEVRQREGAEKRRARISGSSSASKPVFEPDHYIGYPGLSSTLRSLAIASSASDLAEPSAKPDERCTICMDLKKDTLFFPCGHLTSCHPCAITVKERTSVCPICRAAIGSLVKVFIS